MHLVQAIGLDDHHKRHPFAVIFRPPPQPFLSTLTSPSVRPLPAPTALIGSQQVSSETFSKYPQQPNSALRCLVPVISPLRTLRCPALSTPVITSAAEADSRLVSACVWRPARFHPLILSHTLASRLSPFSIASSPPFTPSLARCSLIHVSGSCG
jgi:hypothetical protein